MSRVQLLKTGGIIFRARLPQSLRIGALDRPFVGICWQAQAREGRHSGRFQRVHRRGEFTAMFANEQLVLALQRGAKARDPLL
jgi:hypothetical protein